MPDAATARETNFEPDSELAFAGPIEHARMLAAREIRRASYSSSRWRESRRRNRR